MNIRTAKKIVKQYFHDERRFGERNYLTMMAISKCLKGGRNITVCRGNNYVVIDRVQGSAENVRIRLQRKQ